MSKRDGNTAAVDYLKDGYLPEAILNHLMFLGWNPGTEKEIYSLNEFINDFSLEKIHSTDLVTFNFDKLNWFNTEYLKKLTDKEFLVKLKYWSGRFNMPCLISDLEKNYSQEQVLSIIRLSKERLVNFSEFDKNIDYYLNNPSQDALSLGKYSNNPREILEFFYESISSIEDFSFNQLDTYLHGIVKENNYSMKEYFMTLRISITGESITPPIIDIISILGKEETLNRIKTSIDCL
jgi:glutamyl/glutaminyl-tRNA synthetase